MQITAKSHSVDTVEMRFGGLDMTLVAGALTFLFFLAVASLFYLPAYREHYDAYGVRVRPRARKPELAVTGPSESQLGNAFVVVGEMALTVLPAVADSRTVNLMLYANHRSQRHMAAYTGVRTVFAGAIGLIMLLGSAGNGLQMLLIVPAVACAWMLPNFFLAAKVRRRQQAILSELPTVVDLMIVCAQAGVGLLMCIDKVGKEVKESCPHLSGELEQLINDIKVFATPTSTALTALGDRCGVDEVSNLMSTLVACETKGSDISYPLKQQSQAIRERIKRKKEEEAAKTPVKMVPVIMIFIMPLILCPMLGPAVVIIIQALWPLFGKQ
jgi:tight adherence protein C